MNCVIFISFLANNLLLIRLVKHKLINTDTVKWGNLNILFYKNYVKNIQCSLSMLKSYTRRIKE